MFLLDYGIDFVAETQVESQFPANQPVILRESSEAPVVDVPGWIADKLACGGSKSREVVL